MLIKMPKLAKALLILAPSLLLSTVSFAETVVVVNPGNGNSLTAQDITRIYQGKKKSFADGSTIVPLDQKNGSAGRAEFVKALLNKSPQQYKAYWAKLLFTGKGTPPKSVDSSAEVKSLVAKNPSTIGYIDVADVDASVKVVHKL